MGNSVCTLEWRQARASMSDLDGNHLMGDLPEIGVLATTLENEEAHGPWSRHTVITTYHETLLQPFR